MIRYSAAHGGVPPQAATPEELVERKQRENPADLDAQALQGHALINSPGENGTREIHLVVEGKELRHAKQPLRQQIEREDLSTQQTLDGHRENNKSLNFQKPKGQHSEAVGYTE